MANGHPVSDSRVVYGVLIVIGLLAFVMLVAGLVTPAWLVMDYSELIFGLMDLKFSMGLWYVTYCINGVCESKELNDFWDNMTQGIGAGIGHSMTEYKVEAIISVVNMIIVMVCLLKIICYSPNGIYKNSKGLWIVMCVCSAISAICALTAAGKYGQEIAKAHSLLDKFALSPYKLPYSIVVEGVGGVLTGLFFIIIVLETIRASNRINSANQPQTYAMTTYPSGAHPHGTQPYAAQPYSAEPNAGQKDSDQA